MSLIDTNEDLADPSMTNVANKTIIKPVGSTESWLGERWDKEGEKDGVMAQWGGDGTTVSIHEKERAPRARVVRGCTFASSLNLTAAEQGVVYEVGKATVQVHRRQATHKAVPGGHEFRQVVIHVGPQSSDVEVTWTDTIGRGVNDYNMIGCARIDEFQLFTYLWGPDF